jgi:hypothetical protein
MAVFIETTLCEAITEEGLFFAAVIAARKDRQMCRSRTAQGGEEDDSEGDEARGGSHSGSLARRRGVREAAGE